MSIFHAEVTSLWNRIITLGATHVAFNCESGAMILSNNNLVLTEVEWPHAHGHDVAIEMSHFAAKYWRGYYAMVRRIME